jgi:hypothetical protein
MSEMIRACAGIRGELLLQLFHLLAQNKALGHDHFPYFPVDLILDGSILGLQVQKRNLHACSSCR